MTNEQFKKLALSFEGTMEAPHFERRAFKVINKKIFATLHEASGTANVMFSPEDQYVYCRIDSKAIYPVPNKWGLKGATTFVLKDIDKQVMLDALNTAYQKILNTAKKKKK